MKRQLVLTCGSVLLAVGAACAGGEDDPAASEPSPDAKLGDAAPPTETIDGDGDGDASPDTPTCSAAGWCKTELPDSDLVLKDVWALPGHAFAIAESPTRGVKVLEWKDADAKWIYIDDNTQNESGRGQYAGKIWSPNDGELYFAVAPRTIYHGTKQSPPNVTWKWTHQELEDRTPQYPAYGDHYRGRPTFAATNTTYVALGVFGTGPDDVYAWYANAIYRATKDRNGNEAWVVEYVADDRDNASEQLFFVGATATSKDDVWFAGGRGGPPGPNGCPVLVHKTAAGYRRVADGVPATSTASPGSDGGILFPAADDGGIVLPPPGDGGIISPPPSDGGIVLPPPGDGGIVLPPPSDGGLLGLDGGVALSDGGLIVVGGASAVCRARPGTLLLGSNAGWLAGVEAIGPQRVVMLKGGREVVKVARNAADYDAEVAALPSKPSHVNFISLWTARNESLWLGGPKIVLRGSPDLSDGGTYEVSSIALTGAWLDTPIYQIRGSSNVDRWAVGARHALHKTTP